MARERIREMGRRTTARWLGLSYVIGRARVDHANENEERKRDKGVIYTQGQGSRNKYSTRKVSRGGSERGRKE